MNLREYARDKPCDIRVPEHCCFDPRTSVWAHARLIGVSGMSLKAPDICGCVACHICHDIVDNRACQKEFTYDQRRLLLLEGVMRRQAILVMDKVLRW